MDRLMGEWIYVVLNRTSSLPYRSWSGMGVRRNYAAKPDLFFLISPVNIHIKIATGA
jgi:hypothetical protein